MTAAQQLQTPPTSPAAPAVGNRTRTARLLEFIQTGNLSGGSTRSQLRRDVRATLQELDQAKEETARLQAEERQARRYPWPPRSPAYRVQRALKHGTAPDPADIAAVLDSYALLVLVSKRGESND